MNKIFVLAALLSLGCSAAPDDVVPPPANPIDASPIDASPDVVIVADASAPPLEAAAEASVQASAYHDCAYTSGNGATSAAYESWLGAPVPYGESFLSDSSWDFLDGSGAGAQSFFAGWSNWTKTSGHALVLALPLEQSGAGYAGLAACANGDYAAHWKSLGQNLAAAGLGNTILRPGWEFNGDWSTVYANGHESDFIGCFRSVVDSMRSVAGTSFVFTWNPSVGVSGGFDAENAWPGDSYVDVIGIDIYDISYSSYPTSGVISNATYAAVWSSYMNESHGLAFWAAYAKTHQKPLSFPEWGLWARGDSHHGGGDDPAFVQSMHDFISSNDVAYACYFDVHAHDGDHQLWPGTGTPVVTAFPQGKQTYVTTFGP